MYSFWLAAFVDLEYVIVLQWIAAGPPGKSMWWRLTWITVPRVHDIMMDFIIWGHLTRPPGTIQSPVVRADAQC